MLKTYRSIVDLRVDYGLIETICTIFMFL